MAAARVDSPISNGQPDIGYTPDYEKYLQRRERRLKEKKLEETLPEGFPKELHSDLVWDNQDIESRYNWTYELNTTDLDEIEKALQHFRSLEKPLGFISQNTFPLLNLHERLRAISQEIHNGHGFKVLQGISVDKYSREGNFIICAGLASHIAPIRGRQDNQYDGEPADVVLIHIKDLTEVVDASKIGAPAYTTNKQVFHTDSGDLIALFCLETAAEGGKSKVSSSWRVCNELAATRPDLTFDDKTKGYVSRPLLYHQPPIESSPERMIIQYARRTFTGFKGLPRSPYIPPITEAQAEALDTLHFLAEKYALALDFQKGDIQFVNNLSVFHARDGFTNTPNKQRHLTPEALEGRWSKVYDGVSKENQVFPLEPYIRSASLGKSGDR
ncbi:hypothetical protein BCR34DRAFT_627888 [Clohesyomyces aquaticus]|uniref:TauD/TfdA-like domain-containing protein n=1 Tax=Clohesyomyces aquaticus TaxID=1231657 RepID=A0A1Y1YS77_9PLEO|nr:hypothetical protein BCR34DRAFT_627888 [Clohesyomyces aquaticus]